MAPFHEAVRVERVSRSDDGLVNEYAGHVDPDWSVGGIPHGGYQASVLLSALAQQDSPHKDPAHLMMTFYRPAVPAKPIRIVVKTVKTGKGWTNYEIKTFQSAGESEPIVTAHAVYTNMPDMPDTFGAKPSNANQNLLPTSNSPFAPLSPFLTHPSKCSSKPVSNERFRRWSSDSAYWFLPDRMKWAEDPAIRSRRQSAFFDAKLDWGAWCEFTHPNDLTDLVSLGFWSDMMSSIPEILPPEERVEPHYYPTLAMSCQFHAKLPLPEEPYLVSPQTVGCYSYGKTIHAGRHEQCVEVWTAPSPIEQGEEQPEWRKRSMLLLTSTQLALSVPFAKMKKPPPGLQKSSAASGDAPKL